MNNRARNTTTAKENKYRKMAEANPPSTGKGLGKVLQRTVTRTKEKVMRNLGKADKTRDEEFEQHVTSFNDQQAAAAKLQKELKHYMACVKEMSTASYNMYKSIKETYESSWTGYTEICSATENLPNLWEDYMLKLTDQVSSPLTTYLAQFPDMKAKIAKRGRKLTDYDSARHNHESMLSNKKADEARIAKVVDELNEARNVYESINTELHEELPSLFYSRVNFLSSIFNSMFTAEAIFQHESAKLKDLMADVSHKLSEETTAYRPRLVSEEHPIRNNTNVNAEERYVQHEFGDKVPTGASSEEASRARIRSTGASGQINVSSPVRNDIPTPVPRVVPNDDNSRQSVALRNARESEATRPSETKADSDGEEKLSNIQRAAHIANGVDSSSKNEEEEEEQNVYKVPTSNEAVVPSHRILFRVEATHSYVGDDVDELSFEIGEIITVVPFDNPEEQDEGWLTGIKESTREKGVFPENFTRRI